MVPYFAAIRISIHALREEGDGDPFTIKSVEQSISIHALREEGDNGDHYFYAGMMEFLSTPSARRATRGGVGFMLFK